MEDKKSLKIAELENIIKEAHRGAFGFMIRDDETLQQGMARNHQEFDDERSRLNKQIKILKEMIVEFEMSQIHWSGRYSISGNSSKQKEYERKLFVQLEAQLLVKEAQNAKTTKNVS